MLIGACTTAIVAATTSRSSPIPDYQEFTDHCIDAYATTTPDKSSSHSTSSSSGGSRRLRQETQGFLAGARRALSSTDSLSNESSSADSSTQSSQNLRPCSPPLVSYLPPPPPPPPPPGDSCINNPEWTTIWQDEFSDASLDPVKWSYQIADGEQYGIEGWGNKEIAYYTNRSSNVFISDGSLVIRALYEPNSTFLFEDCWAECRQRCQGADQISLEINSTSTVYQACLDVCGVPRCETIKARGISSARLRTYKQFFVAPSAEFPLIRIEVNADLPRGEGMWPAVWMLPESGSRNESSGAGVYGKLFYVCTTYEYCWHNVVKDFFLT